MAVKSRCQRSVGSGVALSGVVRCVHDDGDADEADQGAGDVSPVGLEPVECHSPRERSRDEYAAVCVEDTTEVGGGLQCRDEPVEAERDDASADRAGSGIGLTISRAIIEGHGGRVTATSPGRGRGAVLIVELPRAGASDLTWGPRGRTYPGGVQLG